MSASYEVAATQIFLTEAGLSPFNIGIWSSVTGKVQLLLMQFLSHTM
jgi:hypothetical protein